MEIEMMLKEEFVKMKVSNSRFGLKNNFKIHILPIYEQTDLKTAMVSGRAQNTNEETDACSRPLCI